MPSDLVAVMRETTARYGLLAPGESVVVAVSGGPDSVALVHALARQVPDWHLSLHVAHLNHGLRGAESDGEEAYVRRLARRLELPCTTERVDVGAEAKRRRVSVEVAAREVRYEFLERVQAQTGASKVALAHTASDRAETLLMNLMRGAGLEGLAGMPPQRGVFVRPLYNAFRADTVAYCRRHRLRPREDSSNRSLDFTRNRVRLELLPLMAQIVEHDVVPGLVRASDLLAADGELLQRITTERFYPRAAGSSDGAPELSLDALEALHVAAARRVIRMAYKHVCGTTEGLSADQVERVLDLARRGRTGGQVVLPGGCEVTRGYRTLAFARTDSEAGGQPAEACEVELAVPGRTRIEWAGLELEAALHRRKEVGEWPQTGSEALLDADIAGTRLTARPVRAGDRFQPLGLAGTKKLQDFLVDEKVPRSARQRMVLVTRPDGIVLWLVGHRLDHRARVRPETERVLWLRARPCGDGTQRQ